MSLRNKTINSVFWTASAKIIGQVFSWIVTIILARLLMPQDFGLIAIAW